MACEHDVPQPNAALGLAAMTWALGMPSGTGGTLFAAARTAGGGGPLPSRARRAAIAPPGPGRLLDGTGLTPSGPGDERGQSLRPTLGP
jgi:hypothetical protein